MRSTSFAAAALLSAVQYANAQTFTSCNPLQKTCPSDPALGETLTTDFTKGASNFWTLADATKMSYDGNGANFVIKTATDAPTISASKYIMFGKVTVTTRAAPGQGIVSSFILESDDLDEIDWEWLGSTDSSVESNFFGKGNTTSYDRAIYHPVADPAGTWHTYTIDWTAQAIKWYIDGALVRTLAYNDPLTVGGYNYPQTPMKVKLGNWVGCASAAAASDPATQGTCSWAGGPANFAQAPFAMLVKSVVIQDYGCGSSYSYSDNSGSYQSIKSSGSCSGGSSTTGGDSGSGSGSSSSSSESSSSASSTTTKAPATTKTTSTKATTTADPTTSSSSTPTSGSNSTVASTGGATQTTSTTGPPLPSHNAAAGLQRSMGLLDYAVVVLGLGLGALVM
jgi:beta-glucanase (GH16 family)